MQLLGGPKRQMGVMLSTGLLIGGLGAGWAVIAGICIRLFLSKFSKEKLEDAEVVAAGCIAGDVIWSFSNNLFKVR